MLLLAIQIPGGPGSSRRSWSCRSTEKIGHGGGFLLYQRGPTGTGASQDLRLSEERSSREAWGSKVARPALPICWPAWPRGSGVLAETGAPSHCFRSNFHLPPVTPSGSLLLWLLHNYVTCIGINSPLFIMLWWFYSQLTHWDLVIYLCFLEPHSHSLQRK